MRYRSVLLVLKGKRTSLKPTSARGGKIKPWEKGVCHGGHTHTYTRTQASGRRQPPETRQRCWEVQVSSSVENVCEAQPEKVISKNSHLSIGEFNVRKCSLHLFCAGKKQRKVFEEGSYMSGLASERLI